jgi:putative ABC transport system substrate-binding protein
VLRDLANPAGIAQFSAIQAVGTVSPVSVRDAKDIERAIAAVARSTDGGLIVTGSASVTVPRDLIVTLAARYKIPAIYSSRFIVTRGGLISYNPARIDQYRRAAGYVDRVLKGANPTDLPVQAPTKYELVVNLKAAEALGLTVPPTLLAQADQLIELTSFTSGSGTKWTFRASGAVSADEGRTDMRHGLQLQCRCRIQPLKHSFCNYNAVD